jgi:hypothetical protein
MPTGHSAWRHDGEKGDFHDRVRGYRMPLDSRHGVQSDYTMGRACGVRCTSCQFRNSYRVSCRDSELTRVFIRSPSRCANGFLFGHKFACIHALRHTSSVNRSRGSTRAATMLPVTPRWVHATSRENVQRIDAHGAFKPSGNLSEQYDGVLVNSFAPPGMWFNANYYQHNLITLTVYPETCNEARVPGLVARVSDLLGTTDELRWLIFPISNVLVGYRQIKYACAVHGSPEHYWLLAQRVNPLPSNRDAHVHLQRVDGAWVWRAVDANARVLIGVFFMPPHSAEIPRALFEPQVHYMQMRRSNESMPSPGQPSSSVYGQRSTQRYGNTLSTAGPLFTAHLELAEALPAARDVAANRSKKLAEMLWRTQCSKIVKATFASWRGVAMEKHKALVAAEAALWQAKHVRATKALALEAWRRLTFVFKQNVSVQNRSPTPFHAFGNPGHAGQQRRYDEDDECEFPYDSDDSSTMRNVQDDVIKTIEGDYWP